MLHEYRKKTTIKAEQFDGSDEMIGKYSIIDRNRITPVPFHATRWYLITKEGTMDLHEGDWIATGIAGEHWAIDNNIFRQTYERCD